MPSIDERVVEMQFRRDDFLKGTQETLTALDKLDSSLSGNKGIAGGLSNIESKFSGLGAVATGALLKLGGMAAQAGTSLFKNVIDPIFTGGRKRALNLEHANFQLTGIMANAKGVKDPVKAVADVMKDVSYAVDGTAYGLDAAAVAAAQFAATGMRGGKEMADALRGISGVAAMAGSSYEDVASVFTKVAGQGRLMGDDLNRLAARGINAAATLADSMGITESEVRKMVSEGKIGFAAFAQSMNDAFGEHATKANETYVGSLSNIKSALGRIGAEFFTIEMEKQRRIFNAIRPVVNNFKKALDPVWKLYKDFVAVPFAEKVEQAGEAMANWKGWGKAGEEGVGALSRAMTAIFKIGLNIKDMFASWLAPVGDAFRLVFAGGGGTSWIEKLADWLEGIADGTKSLKATESQADAVRKVFVKVFDAVKKVIDFISTGFSAVGPAVQFLFDIFKVGLDWIVDGFKLIEPYISKAFDYLIGLKPSIQNFFQDFRDEVSKTGSVWTALSDRFKGFASKYVTPIVEAFKRFKDALLGVKQDGLSGLGANFEYAFAPLKGAWEFLKSVGGGFKTFFDGIKNPVGALKAELPSVGDQINKVLTWIKDQFDGLGGIAESVFDTVGKALESLGKTVGQMTKDVSIEDINKFGEVLVKLAIALAMYKSLKSVQGTFNSISGFFGSLTTAVNDFNDRAAQALKGNTFLKVAVGIGILAGSLWLLSKIDPGALWGSVAALTVMGLALTGMMYILSKINPAGLVQAGLGLAIIAFAIGGFATAIAILGLMPVDVLTQGGIALGSLLTLLTVMGSVLGQLAPSLLQGGLGIAAIAGALTLLVIPVQILGTMPYDQLIQGMGAVVVLLGALTGAALIIGELGPNLLIGSIGVAVLAGALTLLIIPIQTLGAIPYDQLIQGMGATIVTLGVLVAAAFAMQNAGIGALGLIALGVALIALGAGLMIVASIPFGAAAGGLVIIAGALLLLVAASYAAMGALPGVLALAGLMLAFGVAAALVGVGALLMATAALVLSAALPGLSSNLLTFAAIVPSLAKAAPAMIVLGAGLAAFGAGALVAGAGAVVLGLGLLAMGLGINLILTAGPAGVDALVNLVKAIAKLVPYAVPLGIMAGAFTALGLSLNVLGVGLVVAAVGAIALALALVTLTLAFAAAYAVMTLAAGLAPLLANGFSSLQTAVGPITSFGTAITSVLTPMGQFVSLSRQLISVSSALSGSLSSLGSGFTTMGTSASTASNTTSTSISTMASSIDSGASKVTSGSNRIAKGVSDMGSKVSSATPKVGVSVRAMISGLVSALTTGASRVESSSTKIVTVFTKMKDGIEKTSKPIATSAKKIVDGMVSSLSGGQPKITSAINNYVKAFDKLSSGISQNGSKVSKAASSLTTSARNGINNGKGAASNAAYSVGAAIANGMVNGLRAGSSKVSAAARTMASNALSSAKNTLGVKSPSTEFFDVASFSVDGWVNGIFANLKRVVTATSTVGEKAIDAVKESFSDVGDELMSFGGSSFSPVITPIVDSSQAKSQIIELENLFGTTLTNSQLSGLALLDQSLRGPMVGSESDSKVTFIQNNSSPKALSASEIYRQTRNQISKLQTATV